MVYHSDYQLPIYIQEYFIHVSKLGLNLTQSKLKKKKFFF